MGALAGLGAGGAVGGIVGTLGLGIPEYEAKRYEGAVKEGGIHSSPSTVIPQSRSRKLCSEEIYSTSENCAGVPAGLWQILSRLQAGQELLQPGVLSESVTKKSITSKSGNQPGNKLPN